MADRNPTKQRRAAQNKSARQALATRTVKANEPRRTVVEADDPPAARSTRGRGRAGAPSRTSGGSTRVTPRGGAVKGNQGRPARTAAAVPARQPTNPITKAIAEVQTVPGGKGVFVALLFAIMAAVMILGFKVTPQPIMVGAGRAVGHYRVETLHYTAGKFPADTYIPAIGTAKQSVPRPQYNYDYALAIMGNLAIAFALAPLVIAGVAFGLARRDNSKRTFMVAAFAMVLLLSVGTVFIMMYLFTAAGLIYAAFKARQADPPQPRGRRARAQDQDEDDDLDDEGDEDDLDDED